MVVLLIGDINEKIHELKDDLDKLKEQLRHIDLKGLERFDVLLNWVHTIQNYVDTLKKYVDAEHELSKQMIETLEFYGKEIEALKEKIEKR